MKQYHRIIFVAESGTCRAPMAAAILSEQHLNRPIEILSRGLVVLFPEPLNQKAEAVMISNGIHLENYASKQLSAEDITEDTLVIVMEHVQKERVLALLGDAITQDSVCVLNELVGEELEIMDPYGTALPSYGLCYESINRSIKKLVKIINENEGEA